MLFEPMFVPGPAPAARPLPCAASAPRRDDFGAVYPETAGGRPIGLRSSHNRSEGVCAMRYAMMAAVVLAGVTVLPVPGLAQSPAVGNVGPGARFTRGATSPPSRVNGPSEPRCPHRRLATKPRRRIT